MDFNLQRFLEEHNCSKTQKCMSEIIAADSEEIAIKQKLSDLMDENRAKIILVVGPYGSGKSTMCFQACKERHGGELINVKELNSCKEFVYLGEFGDKLKRNPRLFEESLDRGVPVVAETHPYFLMPEFIERYNLTGAHVVEKPNLRDQLVNKILLEAFGLPEKHIREIEGLVGGSLRTLVLFNNTIRFSMGYGETHIKFLYDNIENTYLNYEAKTDFGLILEKIGFSEELSEEDKIGLEIALKMRLVVMEEEKPMIRSLYWRDKYRDLDERFYGLIDIY